MLSCVATLSIACSTEHSNSVVPIASGVGDKGSSNARKPSFSQVNPSPPDNGGGCIDAWSCGSGTTPGGGGSGGSGGTGDGTQVTLLKPAPGLPCRGSDSVGIVLDDQLPFGSAGTSNDVNNIYYLYEGAQMSANGVLGGEIVVGWVATTANGYFVVSNGKDANLVRNIIAQIPVIGQSWAAVNNSLTGVVSPSLTGSQINQVFSTYPVNGKSGNGSASCFTNPLPASQWT